MGSTHFLTKTLPKVAAEMALSVLAYNLTRVMNIVGTKLRSWPETVPVLASHQLPWEGCFYTAKTQTGRRGQLSNNRYNRILPIFGSYVTLRRRRGRMSICYPHCRTLKYTCDQPGIRVGFFVILIRSLSPSRRTELQRPFIIVWLEHRP
jgi:hypothetical protein